MNNSTKKKRIGTLDIFIIFAVIACIVCIAIKYFMIDKSGVSEKVQLEDYVISFSASGIKDSSANNYMTPGTKFYIKDTNTYFGSLMEGLTIKDAKKYYELQNGEVVVSENNAVGDLYRVDVEAKVSVKGKMDANGCFLLNGNTYVGVNKSLTLNSKYLSVSVIITDISKAQ